jgi:hypothetical protein
VLWPAAIPTISGSLPCRAIDPGVDPLYSHRGRTYRVLGAIVTFGAIFGRRRHAFHQERE